MRCAARYRPVVRTASRPAVAHPPLASRHAPAAGMQAGSAADAAADAVSATAGRQLAPALRATFEPRFGRDLSHVRLHADSAAGRAAQGIGARAYAHGGHIAFAPGEYRPDRPEGRRLIAHEIAHTLQPGSSRVLRRTCPVDPARIPPGGSTEFEAAVDAIRALDAYRTLSASAKATADHIIDGARGGSCPMYYVTRLRLLFDTPVNPPAQTASDMRSRSIDAARAERQRLRDPVAAMMAGVEEQETARPGRRWRDATGDGGTRYRIDESDLRSIHVHMKVRPRPRGAGTDADVQRTIGLEDGIETEAATRGYLLDIEFVDRAGPDVFEVGVDPSRWVTARNWVGGTRPLAHEAHHLLGLADRYDYTSHATNRNMQLGTRLHWFREQMVRAADPLAGQSLMEGSRSQSAANEQDICALTAGDFRDCLVTRFTLRTARDIEGIATGLSRPYRPQHGALLQVLALAWTHRPQAERTANCQQADPRCGWPADSVFHDSAVTSRDAARFPLANPHRQPAGSALPRTPRATP